MLTQTMITIGNTQYKKTVSDTYYISKVGTNSMYSEAIDLLASKVSYIETDQLLPTEEDV